MSHDEHKSSAAWGGLWAQVPEVRELTAFRETLPESMGAEDRADALKARADTLGLSGRKIIAPWFSEESCSVDAEQLVHELVSLLFAKIGPMTAGEVLDWLASSAGWDEWLIDFVETLAETGEAPPMYDLLEGKILSFTVGSGEDAIPWVVGAANPKTRRTRFLELFKQECIEAFEGIPNPEPATIEKLAWVQEQQAAGHTPSEITWLWLEREYPEIRAADEQERKDDYSEEHEKEFANIRQLLSRGIKDVTQTSSPASQDSD